MRALRSFTVRPRLPAELDPLRDLAMNLRWAWDQRTRDLFRWVDPDAWDAAVHDPPRLLSMVKPERLAQLADDPGFLAYLAEVHQSLATYRGADRWFQGRTSPLRSVAYFSPEFGLAEALPQYSGGLGVLAGDHLKAASDLGVPLVGVGLFYRHGYFRQALSDDGWQQERFPTLDPHAMALSPVDGARVELDLGGTPVVIQLWRAEVGRIPLLFLDTDVEDNDAAGRRVTDRLYGGDVEHRLRQEIVLGVGGVRALAAVGVDPQVFHTNEGHAGFLALERIRRLVTDDGLGFDEAVEVVRAGDIFTTHTPVPAGIDKYPRELMAKYFAGWAAECGIDIDRLMALGRRPDEETDVFNMAVMGLRLAARSNGVSQLHGDVSRRMFSALWPDLPPGETPIGSITNGVHGPSWVMAEMSELLGRYVLPDWDEAEPERWGRVLDAGDDELWRVREQGRERMVAFVRERLERALVAEGRSRSDAAWAREVLDPKALTIGFARRFATYKRATLLLSEPERLRRLLLSVERPVQLVFAGKAHPADEPGKEMIRHIVQLSRDPDLRHRLVFLPDYDMSVARALYQGCDVWLNTPRRPQEACGTSGMKAALNGALNLSILDGWWNEMFDGENGWAITSAEAAPDPDHRDAVEAEGLYELLERQVVPLYYERTEGPVPRRWVQRIKTSLQSLGPRVTATRMVRDYVEQLYEPAATATESVRGTGYARARQLATWRQHVTGAWRKVHVDEVTSDETVAELDTERTVEATVSLGTLSADDVQVQLLHGRVGPNDELDEPTVVTMEAVATLDEHHLRYRGSFECAAAGRYGFTVRVVPSHPDLVTPLELGLAAWGA